VLKVPPGTTADNAGLAFSPDNRRFAFSASGGAVLWDVESGHLLKSWALWPSLQDALVFEGTNKLWLYRAETLRGVPGPFGNASPYEHPRVVRVRDLLSDLPTNAVLTLTNFSYHIYVIAAAPDARHFVVQGRHGERGIERRIAGYEGPAGSNLWWLAQSKDGGVSMDPSGKTLALTTNGQDQLLVDMAVGTILGTLTNYTIALSLGASNSVVSLSALGQGNGAALFGPLQSVPWITLGIDFTQSGEAQFDASGNLFAWGHTDGTLAVFDLKEVNRRLTAIGLGW
jgi:hypothetical protein